MIAIVVERKRAIACHSGIECLLGASAKLHARRRRSVHISGADMPGKFLVHVAGTDELDLGRGLDELNKLRGLIEAEFIDPGDINRDRRMMHKKQGRGAGRARQVGAQPRKLGAVYTAPLLPGNVGIETYDAPATGRLYEGERAFAFREQLREGPSEIVPIVVIAGDDPAAFQPRSERFAQHQIRLERLVLCEIAGQYNIVEIAVPPANLVQHRAESGPRWYPS